jgi:UTP--glucose-1-phosphate uridylyltransferase
VRKIRQQQERAIALLLDRIQLHAELFDLLPARAIGLLHGRGVESLTLRTRDLVARRVLLALQSFELGDDAAPRVFERGNLLERLVGIEPAAAEAGANDVDVISNKCGIEHAVAIVRYDFRVAIVRKAVFPAAGLGTRFLPATKAQPKEMLPLVDKPIIQYGVEEAVASGVDNIILVTGRGKNAIEDHFDVSVELETFLEARGKRDQLDEIRKISNMINFAYVRQGEPLGLGHAVLVARELVGNEPFAVILGDDVIDADPPAIKQLITVYEKLNGPVIAVERVPREDISSYGVIAIEPNPALPKGIYQVRDLVEKPAREDAPSDLAIIGRYVLTPDIFPALAATKSDRTGEIQLTNGLRELLRTRPIYACEVQGVRHDTGNKLGFLKAVVYFALRRPDIGARFSEYLASLDLPAIASKR